MPGSSDPPSSAITPPEDYASRREFLKKTGLFGATAAVWGGGLVALSGRGSADPPAAPPPLPEVPSGQENPWLQIAKPAEHALVEPATSYADITSYNNFYELGLSKEAPAKNAGAMKLSPWTVRIDGHVHKPMTIGVDDMIKRFGLEERIYRMRCVEAWSMVIPWVGFELGKLIALAEPTSQAKFVKLKTLLDLEQLPGQRRPILPWPYEEGLRIDEAMHPLTLLAVGIYGAPLLGQNGAPLRLVVPWKYGFKGIKSIVEIWLGDTAPRGTWNVVQPAEYGFYANVNPAVDHPRWSQATERPIGKIDRIETKPFNGYGEQVAHLYRGMDLVENF
jgi:sulfoxide reductase catalytic subunit YedY